jgi:hypothetical protein
VNYAGQWHAGRDEAKPNATHATLSTEQYSVIGRRKSPLSFPAGHRSLADP